MDPGLSHDNCLVEQKQAWQSVMVKTSEATRLRNRTSVRKDGVLRAADDFQTVSGNWKEEI